MSAMGAVGMGILLFINFSYLFILHFTSSFYGQRDVTFC